MALFDPIYWLILSPGILLALFASIKVKSTFAKYSRIGSKHGYTGAEAARDMLRREGITNVTIEPVAGMLSDHYDPRTRTLRLSEQVYGSRSLSAIGVACHEAGHAIQHAQSYSMLMLRSTLVPVTSLCSSLWIWVLLIGSFIGPQFAMIGILMLGVAVLFSIVTLPVEWDASQRAKTAMVRNGIVTQQEASHAASVLNAAFLTYLASAITAILTLLYWLIRLGLIGGRD